MGHLVGKTVVIGDSLNNALKHAKHEFYDDRSFMSDYNGENVTHLLREKLIVTDKIDSSKKIYKKELKQVEGVLKSNYPDTNQIQVLPLGTFAWNKYEGELVGETKTSKKYSVIAGFSEEDIKNRSDIFEDRLEYVSNKKEAEKKAMLIGFDHVDGVRELDFYNREESFMFNYGNFLKNFPRQSYFGENREFDDIFILNEKKVLSYLQKKPRVILLI
jgi:hypothetical protein